MEQADEAGPKRQCSVHVGSEFGDWYVPLIGDFDRYAGCRLKRLGTTGFASFPVKGGAGLNRGVNEKGHEHRPDALLIQAQFH